MHSTQHSHTALAQPRAEREREKEKRKKQEEKKYFFFCFSFVFFFIHFSCYTYMCGVCTLRIVCWVYICQFARYTEDHASSAL